MENEQIIGAEPLSIAERILRSLADALQRTLGTTTPPTLD